MRNKFSSNLLGKGLISFAAASILVSGVYAASTVSFDTTRGGSTVTTTTPSILTNYTTAGQYINDMVISFYGLLPGAGSDLNMTNKYITLTLPTGLGWVESGENNLTAEFDGNTTITFVSGTETNTSIVNGILNAPGVTNGFLGFANDANLTNAGIAGTTTTRDGNSTIYKADGVTLATDFTSGSTNNASVMKLVMLDMNASSNQITSIKFKNLKVHATTSATAGTFNIAVGGNLQGLDSASIAAGVVTSSALTVAQTVSSATPPSRAIGTVAQAPLSLTFTETVSQASDGRIKLTLSNAKFYEFNSSNDFNATTTLNTNSLGAFGNGVSVDADTIYVDLNNTGTTGFVLDSSDYNISLASSTEGDVTLTVENLTSTNVTTQSLVIAKAINPSASVSYYNNAVTGDDTSGYKTLYSGRDKQFTTDEIRILETVAGSIGASKTVTITPNTGTFNAGFTKTATAVTGYADISTNLVISTSTFPASSLLYTVSNASTGATPGSMRLTTATTELNLTTATAGDLIMNLAGTSGVVGSVKIANIVDATSVSTTTTATTTPGGLITLPDITIKENVYGAIPSSDSIVVQLPAGYTIQDSTNSNAVDNAVNGSTKTLGVTVTAKKADGTDITSTIFGTVPAVTAESDNTNINRIAVNLSGTSSSTTGPVSITISGIKVRTSSTATAGDINAIVSSTPDDIAATTAANGTITAITAAAGATGVSKHTSVKVGAIVSTTLPSITTSGITDADGNITTAGDKSFSAVLTASGNDQGKVGSIFVFTSEGNYITSTGITKTATPFDVAYNTINLGTHTLNIFTNVEIPTELKSGESIFVGYGVGFSVANAITNLNSNGTAVTADTLTDADLGVVTTTPVTETPTGTTTGTVATSAEVSGTSSSVLAANGVVAGESTTTIGNTVLFNDRGFAVDYSNPANIVVTGIGANTIVSAEEVNVADVPAESQYRALVQETQYVKLTANKYLKVVVEKEVADEPVVTSATTPELVEGWNLLGNSSNNTQTVSKDGISITWTFADSTWTQDAPVPASQGFWAKADAAMAGYEFANSGDGTAAPTFTAGTWSLMSSATAQTLADVLTANSGAEIAWTFQGTTWSNASDTAIEAGRGYWVK